eukprot:3756260-Prymnesium_polylepis.1
MTGRRSTNRPAGVTSPFAAAHCAAAKSTSPNSVRSGYKWCLHATSASLRRLQPLEGEKKSQEIYSGTITTCELLRDRVTHG